MPSDADVRRGWPALTVAVGLVAVIVSVDQLLKLWALDNLTFNQPVPFLGELLQLRLIFNSGAAFGLGAGYTWIFSSLAIVAALAIIVLVLPRLRHLGWSVAVAMVLGGIVGNLIDRLARPPAPLLGEVVDFLALPNWPIFNIADASLSIGAVTIVALSLFGKRGLDGKPIKQSAEAETDGERPGARTSEASPRVP